MHKEMREVTIWDKGDRVMTPEGKGTIVLVEPNVDCFGTEHTFQSVQVLLDQPSSAYPCSRKTHE